MLIPLTRETFHALVPLVATGGQYAYCWGKFADVLRRVLYSIIGLAFFAFGLGSLGIWGLEGFGAIRLVFGIIVGLYWLWGPVWWASLRNAKCRRFGYCGFWQGEVWDVFITEELVGQEETVNNRGDLVIVENREKRLNIEVGDESGFSSRMQVPLQKNHQAILPGDEAEMLVFSSQRDLGRIRQTSGIYIPRKNVWVIDYPYIQRDAFEDVSYRLREQEQQARRRPPTRRRRPPQDDRGGTMTRRERGDRAPTPSRRRPPADWDDRYDDRYDERYGYDDRRY